MEYKLMSVSGSIFETSIPPTFMLPRPTSQKRAARRETVVLPPPGRADERRDLALLCGKRHIAQHGLTAVIGKADVIEHDIAAVVCELILALLNGVVKDLVHAFDIRAR